AASVPPHSRARPAWGRDSPARKPVLFPPRSPSLRPSRAARRAAHGAGSRVSAFRIGRHLWHQARCVVTWSKGRLQGTGRIGYPWLASVRRGRAGSAMYPTVEVGWLMALFGQDQLVAAGQPEPVFLASVLNY